tara:strand:+ start:292 stop:900 length:609 start_codon:yes stop_codon:yes gene_type:complete
MEIIYSYETPDDGYFKLFKVDCNIEYGDIYNDIKDYVYDCDGFSINSRNSGLFTNDREKVGQPLCREWGYIPERYIYQPFTPLLKKLLNIVQPIYKSYHFKDAIVNVYNDGDFISYHKDYHPNIENPCSVVFSFEYDEEDHHVMEFYRTTGDDNSKKKERGDKREQFYIILPHKSIGLMVGMQKKYVHSIKPGNKRISVVFR